MLSQRLQSKRCENNICSCSCTLTQFCNKLSIFVKFFLVAAVFSREFYKFACFAHVSALGVLSQEDERRAGFAVVRRPAEAGGDAAHGEHESAPGAAGQLVAPHQTRDRGVQHEGRAHQPADRHAGRPRLDAQLDDAEREPRQRDGLVHARPELQRQRSVSRTCKSRKVTRSEVTMSHFLQKNY